MDWKGRERERENPDQPWTVIVSSEMSAVVLSAALHLANIEKYLILESHLSLLQFKQQPALLTFRFQHPLLQEKVQNSTLS